MSGAEQRRPGRPRRAEIDEAVLAATRALLVDVGYGELTIEAVARRAGVGKPTVYRRHGSKASLVAAALIGTLDSVNPAPPDTGDVKADVRLLLGNLAEALTTTDFGPAVTDVVSPAARDEELAEVFRAALERRRTVIRLLLERARSQRRLVAQDVETAIDMALGAIYFRHLISHDVIDTAFIEGLVDSIVRPAAA